MRKDHRCPASRGNANPSLRRTKVALVYKRKGNLRACQLLLGHFKLKSTMRDLGIEVDDALILLSRPTFDAKRGGAVPPQPDGASFYGKDGWRAERLVPTPEVQKQTFDEGRPSLGAIKRPTTTRGSLGAGCRVRHPEDGHEGSRRSGFRSHALGPRRPARAAAQQGTPS